MKLPSMQFYPADWRKDPGVQSLTYEERGVWFEILCLMHESSERGVLLLNGKPMPEKALANNLGIEPILLKQILTTLVNHGVSKIRAEDGAMYSKRMVDDEKLIQIRRNAGKKGGNPILLKQTPTTPVKQTPTTPVKQIPTPSSSSSTSVINPIVPCGTQGMKKAVNEICEDFQTFWKCYPRKTGKDAALKKWNERKRSKELPSIEVILSAIRKQIQSRDWQKEKGQFIPHPATWLNQGRWDDGGIDYEALRGKTISSHTGGPAMPIPKVDEDAARSWLIENYATLEHIPIEDYQRKFNGWPEPIREAYLRTHKI